VTYERPDELREAQAPESAYGERIDAWAAREWPDLSRSRVQGLIGQGRMTLDGAPVKAASEKVRAGLYVLTLPPPEPAAPEPETIALDIAFEDEHLIVVNKAAGMAMHPAPGSMHGTMVNALLAHCAGQLSGIGGVARPGIVHRIDKDTTGLVVVAKHDAAHAGLAKQFADHTIERASTEDRRKQAVVRNPDSDAGRHAITHYWTIEAFGNAEGASAGHAAAAFVECRLETGRTHQIRAHLGHIGAPLIGDPLYGKFRGLKLAGVGAAIEAAKDTARDFPRQALHAAVLGFIHPVTGQALRFEAPLPEDMQALLSALRAI
jgi:23S rRNA pseudouridine1911/1915/1917 synthase